MKGKLLELLSREKRRPLSGQYLASLLGVSRVSIWKHIRKLQQLGYEIRPSAKGYRLIRRPDALFPWEFPAWESRIEYFPVLDSTMNRAKELARRGCQHLTVVAANRQTKGRGRMDRGWHSAEGGLYFTVVTRPGIPPALMHRLGFTASVCLVRSLAALYKIEPRIKWPNDILLNGGKLCGILCEMEAEADAVRFLNIGIGINVNNRPQMEKGDAISLSCVLKRGVARKEILARFLNEFEREIERDGYPGVLEEWRSRSITLNKRVEVVMPRETIRGTAVDIGQDGALIVESVDGSRKRAYYGDCFHSQSGKRNEP